MMTISAQDVFTLLVQELHKHRILVIEISPEGKFRLQDDAQLICSDESSLWRTPTMEAHVVQAIGSTIAKILLPRLHIHCHMTCQRPNAGIVFPPKENPMPIGIKVLTFNMEVLENRVDFPLHYRRKTIRQLYPANDTVPVGLSVFGIGMTIGIDLFWYTTAVVYHDREGMTTRRQHLREIEHLRRGDIVGTPDKLAVHINL